MIHILNDAHPEATGRLLVAGNALAAVLSGAAALLAWLNPSLLVAGSVTPMVNFYVNVYVARQPPLSAVLLGLLATRGASGLRALLLVSGLAQAGDAVVGAWQAQPAMIIAPTVATVIHLGSAFVLGGSVARAEEWVSARRA